MVMVMVSWWWLVLVVRGLLPCPQGEVMLLRVAPLSISAGRGAPRNPCSSHHARLCARSVPLFPSRLTRGEAGPRQKSDTPGRYGYP
jgi:hypothetical protein